MAPELDTLGQKRLARQQAKEALVDAVVDLARSRFRELDPDRSERLLRDYFVRVSADDLVGRDATELYPAAVRHWQLGRQRREGETLVRVYNPQAAEDGWQSRHTVVDIVTDDMPFIVDSVTAALGRQGLTIHLLAHPIAVVDRDDTGVVREFHRVGHPEAEGGRESYLHVEVDRIVDDDELDALEQRLRSVLADVRAAVTDWQPMRTKALEIAAEMASMPVPPGVDAGDWAEAPSLLRWLADARFVFIGYREYELHVDDAGAHDGTDGHGRIVSIPDTGLGVLRADPSGPPTVRSLADLPPEIGDRARAPEVFNLTKTNALSTVDRAEPMDYVGIKRFSADGRVLGERRFIGLFTAPVYNCGAEMIPVVRQKVRSVIDRAGFIPGTHDANHLLAVLESFPRDELFQIGADELHDIALGILDLRDRRTVSLFVRADDYGRFLSCLVFVPKDRYTTDVRLEIARILMDAYGGTRSTFSTEITRNPHARVHIVIYTDPHRPGSLPSLVNLEDRLTSVIEVWEDDLADALVADVGEHDGRRLLRRYGGAFPGSYRDDVLPGTAVADLVRLEALGDEGLSVKLLRPLEAGRGELRLKLYRTGSPLTLSAILPLLHDLGAVVTDERPYEVRVTGEPSRWIYDIGMRLEPAAGARDDWFDDGDLPARFEAAFEAAWTGEAESDGFARLVALAGLTWRDAVVVRAYARYLRQTGSTFTPSYVEETLQHHPDIAADLVALFHTRFHPGIFDDDGASARVEATEVVATRITEAIDAVRGLDEDRILRSFLALVLATVRTNHHRSGPDGAPRPTLVLKLDPTRIPELPRPVPAHEVFVYSPRTEGVHLRAATVARGGIRWSDRREDYRTEILGLLKAQTVKNALIVPGGAKGGFVVKHPPDDRTELRAEVLACYELFIGGLLDVTDDLVDGEVVPPPDVVRHDGDDTYLVVAADKGTATFSDTANGIAIGRGFWLADAFASGGSVGYDHKKLGITARGAWESVKRHFRELGVDALAEPITVVGIGDMSGDVFGNGMLESDQLRLVAAFDHRHVFVDPDPDPAVAHAERRRLFDLPGSSWADYDPALISPGGGVFPRDAKLVRLTPEMSEALGTDATELTPNELIRAVLRAPVDLLWNGGIGTYVAASDERNEEIGDRANDAVRVRADELRCRVVGEGGNLGVSERARVEFARRGGRISADFIDNSGGVDCSDREVNLKILLNQVVRAGDLTGKQRDELLMGLAEDVATQVLTVNYAQAETLSLVEAQSTGMVEVHIRHLRWLEEHTGLQRSLETLPGDDELHQRRLDHQGLTRPELATLMAHTKNALAHRLIASDLPDDRAFDDDVAAYFPATVAQRFPDAVAEHPLRRELVATIVSNRLVNRGGVTMVHRLAEETSAPTADIARAHEAAWRVFELDPLWQAVRDLDGIVDASVATELLLEIKRLAERATRWMLRTRPVPFHMATTVAELREPVATLCDLVAGLVVTGADSGQARLAEQWTDQGVPRDLAVRVAGLGVAFGALDLSAVARRLDAPLGHVATAAFGLEERLDLAWLREHIIALPRDDRWRSLARSALRDDFFAEHAALAGHVVAAGDDLDDPEALVDRWVGEHEAAVDRFLRMVAELRHGDGEDLARVSVALRELRHLTQ